MKILSIIAAAALLFAAGTAFAQQDEKITISTYYPAPYGEYESLSVDDPTNNGTAGSFTTATKGEMIVEKDLLIGTKTNRAPLTVKTDDTVGDYQIKAFHDPLKASIEMGASDSYGSIQTWAETGGITPPLLLQAHGGKVGIGAFDTNNNKELNATELSRLAAPLNVKAISGWDTAICAYSTSGNSRLEIGTTDTYGYLQRTNSLPLCLQNWGGGVGIGTNSSTNIGTNVLYVEGSTRINNGGLFIQRGDVGYPEQLILTKDGQAGNSASYLSLGSGWNQSTNEIYSQITSCYYDASNNFHGRPLKITAGPLTISAGALTISATPINIQGLLNLTAAPDKYQMYMTGTGMIGYISSSSLRYKKEISDLSTDIESILKLRPVRFKWKENGAEDTGLIAEEVETAVKDLVIYNKDGQPDGVRYEKVPLYLLDLAKKQQEQIDAQQKELAQLRKELEELKGRK